MKTQATFKRANSAVHLHSIAPVNLNLASVVNPGNTELDNPLRFQLTIKQPLPGIFRMLFEERPETDQHLLNRLVELGLVWITLADPI